MGTLTENTNILAQELQDAVSAAAAGKRFPVATLKQYINEAHQQLHFYLYKHTEFRLTSATIATVSGTQEYDLPATFRQMRRMWRDKNYELQPDHQYRPGHDSTIKGEPQTYYLFDYYRKITAVEYFAQVGFWPIPDAVYTVSYTYFPAPGTLADGDISAIPEEFHDLMRLMAGIKTMNWSGSRTLKQMWEKDRNDRLIELVDFVNNRVLFNEPGFASAFTNLGDE